MDGRPVLAGVVVRFGTESGQEPELFDGKGDSGWLLTAVRLWLTLQSN